MMKFGWKTAKFKDVSTVVGGSTPKTDIPEYWGGDNYWVAPAELDGSKYISSTVKHITDLAVSKTNLTLLPQGTVLLSSRAPIGKVAITTVPMYCNQGFKNIVCGPELFNGYVYYFLRHNVNYLQSLGTGATFKEISKKVVENVSISYPSLAEQQRIVDELDLLSDIIDKKKAQLRDLDALAQSIFYEMFGDPALNDKGWPVKLISDLYDVGSSKRVFESEWRDSGVPFYRAREIVRLSKGLPLEDPIYIEESLFASYKEKYGIPTAGDIMVTGVGTLGVCYLVKNEDRFYFKDGNTLWFRDKHIANSRFIKDQFSTDFVKNQIKENSHGATVGTYTIMTAKKTRVICPPIEIQNQYEVKVAEIDSRIKLIESSLKQVQALFESRMDSYFG